MTADTITLTDLSQLEILLQESVYKIHIARLQASTGDITTEQAAAVVNEVAEAIKLSAR